MTFFQSQWGLNPGPHHPLPYYSLCLFCWQFKGCLLIIDWKITLQILKIDGFESLKDSNEHITTIFFNTFVNPAISTILGFKYRHIHQVECKMLKLFEDYLDSTTVHGFVYIHQRHHFTIRIVWVCPIKYLNFLLQYYVLKSCSFA